MSKTLTVSDEVYSGLEAVAKRQGMESVERLLESWSAAAEAELEERHQAVRRIQELSRHLYEKYGEMEDSTLIVREDRAR
jgi:hypothetical protein